MKKIHRFFYDFKIENDFIVVNDFEILNQIKNVLKFKIGEKLILFFDYKEVLCEIFELNKKNFILKVLDLKEFSENKNKKIISLYQSILKKDNFEFVIQKAVEIGVDRIIPVVTSRTVKINLNYERLNKIVVEACEQSERIDVPEILDIAKFDKCLNVDGDKILFDFSGDDFKDIKLGDNKNVSIFIGPEGGFTDDEVECAKKNGFTISRLGKNVLRGETAAIVASYLIVNN